MRYLNWAVLLTNAFHWHHYLPAARQRTRLLGTERSSTAQVTDFCLTTISLSFSRRTWPCINKILSQKSDRSRTTHATTHERCFKNISLQMHQIMVFICFASRFKGLTRCSKSSGIAIYSRCCWDSVAIPIFWTKQRPGLVKRKYSRASSTWSFRMRGWLWSPA